MADIADRLQKFFANASGKRGALISEAIAELRRAPVWQPIETAPKDDDALFLVCGENDDRGPFVVRARILWSARKSSTPSHLHLHYLTHWMPLPAPPAPCIFVDADS